MTGLIKNISCVFVLRKSVKKSCVSSLFAVLCAVLVSSCVEYHPYDSDITGVVDINEKNISLIEKSCLGRTEIKFVVISDTQRWHDETKEAIAAINGLEDVDFVIHAGDMSDFGLKDEFMWQRDILAKLNVPYVCLIGNHDCIASGEANFRKIFGYYDFAFTAGNIRFICLNTNALEFGYDVPVPDFTFIRKEIANYPDNAVKTIAVMHAAPYSDQFNNNIAEVFHYAVKSFPKLLFCVHGHDHEFLEKEIFNDGVVYYQCGNIKKRGFLVFTVTENDYKHEIFYF